MKFWLQVPFKDFGMFELRTLAENIPSCIKQLRGSNKLPVQNIFLNSWNSFELQKYDFNNYI